VGQDDLPVEEIRQLAPDWIIGLSCNNIDEVRALGADVESGKSTASYYNIGPLYKTDTKEGLTQFIGSEEIIQISSCCSLPFTVIGGIAISGFPLTSGFISKSMIITAAGNNHQLFIMSMLLLAAVGTFLSVGIKLPYYVFFGPRDSGLTPNEAPWNMQVAMGMAAFMCIFLGIYPDYLYDMLPYAVQYHPYTSYHLTETFHLLGFTGLGFYIMVKYLKPHDVSNLDLDWFYRRGAGWFMWFARKPVSSTNEWVSNIYQNIGLRLTMALARALSWFDWEGIDWALDGSARGIVKGGEQVRQFQTGKLQHYIGAAVALLFIVLIVVVLV
jgi:multicomponent Na+:H+ antiporter subunit D